MPELWEIGLDPAVQGVPVKKKPSVNTSTYFEVNVFDFFADNEVLLVSDWPNG